MHSSRHVLIVAALLSLATGCNEDEVRRTLQLAPQPRESSGSATIAGDHLTVTAHVLEPLRAGFQYAVWAHGSNGAVYLGALDAEGDLSVDLVDKGMDPGGVHEINVTEEDAGSTPGSASARLRLTGAPDGALSIPGLADLSGASGHCELRNRSVEASANDLPDLAEGLSYTLWVLMPQGTHGVEVELPCEAAAGATAPAAAEPAEGHGAAHMHLVILQEGAGGEGGTGGEAEAGGEAGEAGAGGAGGEGNEAGDHDDAHGDAHDGEAGGHDDAHDGEAGGHDDAHDGEAGGHDDAHDGEAGGHDDAHDDGEHHHDGATTCVVSAIRAGELTEGAHLDAEIERKTAGAVGVLVTIESDRGTDAVSPIHVLRGQLAVPESGGGEPAGHMH